MTIAPVGPIVGPISSLSLGVSSTADRTGDGTDFAIGGLRFKVAASDEHPYERATAQFRKDQLDTSPTVGDQSLTGWWTRGQLSFHGGAGTKYYEVLEGEEVFNTFYSGLGVNPWTEGKVSLVRQPIERSTTAVKDGVVSYNPTHQAYSGFALTETGSVEYTDAASSSETYTFPVAATTITANSRRRFVTAGNIVHSWTTGTGTAINSPWVTNSSASNNTFVGAWWAKGRIFAVDQAGRWFTAVASASTVVEANAFWASGETSAVGDWAVAETPSSVILGRDNTLYSVSLNTDGSVPTFAAPVVVATLPAGEEVRTLLHYLGHLVILTNLGVRLAVLNSSDELVYGPPIIDFASTTGRHLSAFSNQVQVIGKQVGDTYEGVFELDLGGVTDGLLAPYVRRVDFDTTNVGSAVGMTPEGLLIIFGNTGTWIDSRFFSGGAWQSTLTPSGYVTTGLHRFGTLEPKKFDSVRVRVEGSGGTVEVARVMADGSTVSLYTINLTKSSGEDITLGLTNPIEMVGLKFTLTRDAVDSTKGPTLLGYQLRALPAPSRQRMIRIPLLCFDREQRGAPRAVGHKGSAWERLNALEEMERTGGTFIYQDFRTGEAGECQIESVEFQNKTPPGKQGTGFGGVISLTIRRLA